MPNYFTYFFVVVFLNVHSSVGDHMVSRSNIGKLVVTVIQLLQQPDWDCDALQLVMWVMKSTAVFFKMCYKMRESVLWKWLMISKQLGVKQKHIKPSFAGFWWILCIGMDFAGLCNLSVVLVKVHYNLFHILESKLSVVLKIKENEKILGDIFICFFVFDYSC